MQGISQNSEPFEDKEEESGKIPTLTVFDSADVPDTIDISCICVVLLIIINCISYIIRIDYSYFKVKKKLDKYRRKRHETTLK